LTPENATISNTETKIIRFAIYYRPHHAAIEQSGANTKTPGLVPCNEELLLFYEVTKLPVSSFAMDASLRILFQNR